jgi:hypothetical protein
LARRSSFDRRERLIALERAAVVALGLYLIAVGLRVLAAGEWTYTNYIRSEVAAPVALLIGIVLIVAGASLQR